MRRLHFSISLKASKQVFYALEEVDDCILTRANISGRLTGCHRKQSAGIVENTHDKKNPNASENNIRGREHL